MRIAIPVWENKISPVLDAAEKISIYRVENSRSEKIDEIFIGSQRMNLAALIKENADVIICGALSSDLRTELVISGIKIHSWIMGEITEILQNYITGNITSMEFSMPGCRRRRFKCCAVHNRNNRD